MSRTVSPPARQKESADATASLPPINGASAARAPTRTQPKTQMRFQPASGLTQWYQARFGHASSRLRHIGIVALARKLLIALSRYLETGVVPEGATLKPTLRVR